MSSVLEGIRDRQQHLGYFFICFMLFALAIALVKPVGWWAVIALWVTLAGVLELVYRWTIALGQRNRQSWWAKSRDRNFWFNFRWLVRLGVVAVVLAVRQPSVRYALLALLMAALLYAGVIHWMRRREQP